MIRHTEVSDYDLHSLMKLNVVSIGGNAKLKIYGSLHCASGKRMKKENRVFFYSLEDARANGFRPCGHCMKHEHKKWKNDVI